MIWSSKSEYPGVNEFASKMKEALMKAHDAIIKAQVKQMDNTNKCHSKADFKADELVYLLTKNL